MRQTLALALVGCGLSIGMYWGLVTNIGLVTVDSVDRYWASWQIAWIGHAVKSHPGSIVDTNTFWPLDNSLAFTDAMYGYAPAGMVGSGPRAAMIRTNVLFLFTYALAFFGAGLLARQLGFSWAASGLAAAAFAFAPWRIAHLNHLNVLSSGGIPLSLALLLRGYGKRSGGVVLTGWAVAAWQLSCGFALGIQFAYLLAVLGLLGALRWRSRFEPLRLWRAVAGATVIGVLLFGTVGVAAGLPLLEVVRDHPEARRTREVVALFSPTPSGFLAAPSDNVAWGDLTKVVRESLRWPPEMTLFPGLTLMLLAVGGLLLPVLPARRRWALGLGTAATAVLCLGYSFAGATFTYEPLYRYLPGWAASRTPGRLFTLTSLGLAILAAAGADGIRRLVERRTVMSGRSRRNGTGLIVLAVLTVAILAEGKAKMPLQPLPVSPIDFSEVPDPQLHLPSDTNDPIYMFWSTDGFPRIFNGHTSVTPIFHDQFREQMHFFPDAGTVELLSSAGFRSVIVHLDRIAGTPWEDVPDRSTEGLPLERRLGKGFMIYTLRDRE